MKKVVVLGGGISGLAAGWFLKRKFGKAIELTILEKSERVGGWIRTVREEDFVFEAGPRGFRPAGKGEATLELAKELRLEGELVAASKESRKRYICLGGKLRRFSLGFLVRQGLIGGALHDLFAKKGTAEDETIADFVTRRFNQNLAETVMDPVTKGIFGGDMHELSVRSCLPLLWHFEQEQGSVIRGLLAKRKKKQRPAASLYTFKEGMESLTGALARELAGEIRLGQTLAGFAGADAVISTVSTRELAALMGCEDPCTYTTLSLVHMGWRESVLPKRGYGFLVPSLEKEEILGMTWDSEIFPRGGQTRLCAMIRGSGAEEELAGKALRSLKKIVGIEAPPEVLKVTIADKAIPQYTLNHHQRIEAFKKKLPANVHAIGTCFDGPGVNDCIFNAKQLVDGLSF